MRLIYITGPTSVGKSTFANKICDGATVISLDALSKSVREVFDGFKLYTDEISVRPVINNDKFLSLTEKYIKYFVNDFPDKTLVVEGCHFTPEEFLSVFPNAEVTALGITDSEVAMKQINKREWMSKLDRSVKKEYVNKIVEYSFLLKKNQGKYKYIEFCG